MRSDMLAAHARASRRAPLIALCCARGATNRGSGGESKFRGGTLYLAKPEAKEELGGGGAGGKKRKGSGGKKGKGGGGKKGGKGGKGRK